MPTPFSATRHNEVLCVEARGYTLPDGTAVFVFLAMDAVSLHAHHHGLRQSNTLDDHLDFIRQLPGRCPLPRGMTLASSLAPQHAAHLAAAFPLFGTVLCDAVAVAQVTQEFHTGFRAQTGLRPLAAHQ
jgi:hypothetical protein